MSNTNITVHENIKGINHDMWQIYHLQIEWCINCTDFVWCHIEAYLLRLSYAHTHCQIITWIIRLSWWHSRVCILLLIYSSVSHQLLAIQGIIYHTWLMIYRHWYEWWGVHWLRDAYNKFLMHWDIKKANIFAHIFKCISLNEMFGILIQISHKVVP